MTASPFVGTIDYTKALPIAPTPSLLPLPLFNLCKQIDRSKTIPHIPEFRILIFGEGAQNKNRGKSDLLPNSPQIFLFNLFKILSFLPILLSLDIPIFFMYFIDSFIFGRLNISLLDNVSAFSTKNHTWFIKNRSIKMLSSFKFL